MILKCINDCYFDLKVKEILYINGFRIKKKLGKIINLVVFEYLGNVNNI